MRALSLTIFEINTIMASEYTLSITAHAKEDLNKIYEYLASSQQDPAAAKRSMQKIEEAFLNLSTLPERFEKLEDPFLKLKGYRKCVVHPYVLVYQIDKAADTVYLARVFHESMNYSKYL